MQKYIGIAIIIRKDFGLTLIFVLMSNLPNVKWITKEFSQLSPNELYAILRLRSEVFVVEQNCVFLDMDNNDQKAYHTMGWLADELVATTRLFSAVQMYEGYQSIGRVVGSPRHRGLGIGKDLMQYSIQECERLFQFCCDSSPYYRNFITNKVLNNQVRCIMKMLLSISP